MGVVRAFSDACYLGGFLAGLDLLSGRNIALNDLLPLPPREFPSFLAAAAFGRRIASIAIANFTRSMVAAKIANMKRGRQESNPSIDGIAQADAAKMLNVSTKSVERAKHAIDEGSPAVVADLRSCHRPPGDAVAVARPPVVAGRIPPTARRRQMRRR